MPAETPKDPRILTQEEIDALLSVITKKREVPDLPVDDTDSSAEGKPEQGNLRAAWGEIFNRSERGSAVPADLSIQEQTVVSKVDDKRMETDPLLEAARQDYGEMQAGLIRIQDLHDTFQIRLDDNELEEFHSVINQFNAIGHPNDNPNFQSDVVRVYALYQALEKKFNELSASLEAAPVPAPAAAAETSTSTKELTEQTKDYLAEKFGYVDIGPQVIFDSMKPEELAELQNLLKDKNEAGAIEFFKNKIQQIVKEQKLQEKLTEQKIEEIAAGVHKVIQDTILAEAQAQLAKLDAKKLKNIALAMAKNTAIIGGSMVAIGALGLSGVGVLASAGISALYVSMISMGLRKWAEHRKKKTATKAEEEYKQDLENAKEEFLGKLVVDGNFQAKISALVSNQLREQTSAEAIKQVSGVKDVTLEDSDKKAAEKLSELQQRLYSSSLFLLKNEQPDLSPKDQQSMAMTMALTLSAHQRGEHEAAVKLAELKKKKPKAFELISKFNDLRSGKKPEGTPQTFWEKHKADLVSVGLGTAIGTAVRASTEVRVAFGALTGATLGYAGGNWLDQRGERLALEKIDSFITEAENRIIDLELPATAKVAKLTEDANFVQSQLDLGLLNTNQLLKNRAENFIHNVRQLAMKNQAVEDLAAAQIANDQQVERQVKKIADKLERTSAYKKWAGLVGGAVVGALATDYVVKHFGHQRPEAEHQPDLQAKPTGGIPLKTRVLTPGQAVGEDHTSKTPDSSDGNGLTLDGKPMDYSAVPGAGKQPAGSIEPTTVMVEGKPVVLTEQIKAQIKTGDMVADYGEVGKEQSVSEALDKAMKADAIITVINPDGKVLLGEDGQPVKFDANLVHEGDKVYQLQRADGSKEIFVQKAGITVKEGQSLAGRYDEIVVKFKLDEIPQEVKDRFNLDKAKGGMHERLNYQEAQAARQYWDEHPELHVQEAAPAAGGVAVAPKAEPAVLPLEPALVEVKVDNSDIFAGLDLTMPNGDELHFYDSADDADELPNSLAVKTQDGAVFYQVTLPENLTHDKAEELVAQAKLASANLSEFSKHLGESVERAEAAKFYAVYDQADNVESLAKYQAGDFGQLDEFLKGLKNKDLSLLKLDGQYSEGKFAITSELLKKDGWNHELISAQLSKIQNKEQLNVALELLDKMPGLQPGGLDRALAVAEQLNLNPERELAFARLVAEPNTEFGQEKARTYAQAILGQNYDAVSLFYDRVVEQVHFNGLADGSGPHHDVIFNTQQNKIIIAGLNQEYNLTDDELNRLGGHLQVSPVAAAEEGQPAPETPQAGPTPGQDKAAEQTGAGQGAETTLTQPPAMPEALDVQAQNKAIRQAVDAVAVKVMEPDEELVYEDFDNDGVADVVGLAVQGGRPYFTMALPKEIGGQEQLDVADAIKSAQENLDKMIESLNQTPGVSATRAQAAEFMPIAQRLNYLDGTNVSQGLARAFEATSHTKSLSFEKDLVIASLAQYREGLSGMSDKRISQTMELLFGQSFEARDIHFVKGGNSETLIISGKNSLVRGHPLFIVTLELKNNQYSIVDQQGNTNRIGPLTDQELNNVPYYLRGETPPGETPPEQTSGASAPEQSSQTPPAAETEPPSEALVEETILPREPADNQTSGEQESKTPVAPEPESGDRSASAISDNKNEMLLELKRLKGFKELNLNQTSKITESLKAELDKGLKVPDNGYVIYVNRNPQEQWAALLKFDKDKNQFEALGADTVSTADADRFAGAETPLGVHYVTRVGDAGVWGAPYGRPGHEVYDLSEGEGIAFHPTNEQELLGRPASHGCVRMTDQFNELLDKYKVLSKGSSVVIGDFSDKK